MAVLRLYNQIVDEEEKLFMSWAGEEGVCYKDVNDFISNISGMDNKIDIRIHCPGGDCIEGWAIYDALRTSGKEISATVEGECSSMATIILLAAPIERRFGTQNARILIHNPSIAYLDLWTEDRLTADTIGNLKAKLDAQVAQLIDEQERIMKLYLDRTKADRADLDELMKEERFIDMERAKELGFIGEVLAPNTDKFTKNKHKMTETKVKTSLLNRALAKLGIAKLEDLAPKDQVITGANGDELVVEREEGNPQVGDVATVNGTPEGTVVLEDGSKVVVAEGAITNIEEPVKTPTEDEYKAQIEALNQQVTSLTAEKETLQGEFDAFKATAESEKQNIQNEFDAFKATAESEKQSIQDELDQLKPMAKTEDEIAILDVVEKAGGKDWLEKIKSMSSTFGGSPRQFRSHDDKPEDFKPGSGYLEEIKKKRGLA